MAGDWIKVEHATLDKPEILKTARMLGVKHGEALELYLRWWCWLDVNCVDGLVDALVDQDVDDLLHCPGFSACMRAVGWLKTAPDGRLQIAGFAANNGETSKKRALRNRKQAKWRESVDHDVDQPQSTEASTREEKRRVNTSLRSVLEAPSEEHRALASELSVSCDEQFQRYRDWLASAGKTHRDGAAGFRNWLRKAAEFKPRDVRATSLAEKRAANIAELTGKVRHERTIEGDARRVGDAAIRAISSDLREPGGDDVGRGGPERSAAGMG
jgi:hypothetical protein